MHAMQNASRYFSVGEKKFTTIIYYIVVTADIVTTSSSSLFRRANKKLTEGKQTKPTNSLNAYAMCS